MSSRKLSSLKIAKPEILKPEIVKPKIAKTKIVKQKAPPKAAIKSSCDFTNYDLLLKAKNTAGKVLPGWKNWVFKKTVANNNKKRRANVGSLLRAAGVTKQSGRSQRYSAR